MSPCLGNEIITTFVCKLIQKHKQIEAAFGDPFDHLLVILTSNDDQPIQVETAARCHRRADLLSCADLIDTATEQIKTTFTKGKRQRVSIYIC
jgi:hypothetical protein